MNKHKKTTRTSRTKKIAFRQKLPLIIGAVLLCLLFIGYLSRGWLRTSVLPGYVSFTQGNGGQKAFESATAELQDPLSLLGHQNPEISPDNGCELSYAESIKTEIYCLHAVNSWYEISQDEADKAELNENAARLQDLLKQHGWTGTYADDSEYTSLTRLIGNFTQSIDYTPDATYLKDMGDTTCILSTTTAFSSPSPAAINTHMSCTRIYHIFGDPTPVLMF